jgi:hypothetical protein
MAEQQSKQPTQARSYAGVVTDVISQMCEAIACGTDRVETALSIGDLCHSWALSKVKSGWCNLPEEDKVKLAAKEESQTGGLIVVQGYPYRGVKDFMDKHHLPYNESSMSVFMAITKPHSGQQLSDTVFELRHDWIQILKRYNLID